MATKSEILKQIKAITGATDRSATDLANDPQAREALRLELLQFMRSGDTDDARDQAQQDRLLRLTEDLARASD